MKTRHRLFGLGTLCSVILFSLTDCCYEYSYITRIAEWM